MCFDDYALKHMPFEFCGQLNLRKPISEALDTYSSDIRLRQRSREFLHQVELVLALYEPSGDVLAQESGMILSFRNDVSYWLSFNLRLGSSCADGFVDWSKAGASASS